MTPQSALICLDLDGVSLENDGLHVWFSDDVARALNLAAAAGARWCSNSGRRAENQFGVIQACRTLDALPIAILSGERYIHDIHRSRASVLPRLLYNEVARKLALGLIPKVKLALEPHLEAMVARYPGTEYYPSDEFVGWLLASTDGRAPFIDDVRQRLEAVPDAQVLCNGPWIIVTHAQFGKGRVLTDAAQFVGISRECILAVGDQPNDLDMLDGRAAAFVGCPADADGDVKCTVARAGGWIASAPGCRGTVELIQRFLSALR